MRPLSPILKTPCYQTCVLGALFLLLLLASLRLFAFGCSFPRFFSLFVSPASFYNSVLAAWQKVNGGFSNRSDTLAICASGGLFQQDVSSVSTKLVYSYHLYAAHLTPHCVLKFFPQVGPFYWSCTWKQLFFFDLDRQFSELAWKVAHGVLYAASRLIFFRLLGPPALFLWPCKGHFGSPVLRLPSCPVHPFLASITIVPLVMFSPFS